MSAPAESSESVERVEWDEEVDHLVCDCNEDVALCGEDVASAAWTEFGKNVPCPMCAFMDKEGCPRCGS